mgnify:CR=1 FL=1
MRKALAIFLMLTLMLQSVWGAAEPYCQHEEGAAAHHIGHHLHDLAADQHDAADALAPDADHHGSKDSSKSLSFADHGHHCCSLWVVMPQPQAALPAFVSLSELQAKPVKALRSAFGHRIERPNWLTSL